MVGFDHGPVARQAIPGGDGAKAAGDAGAFFADRKSTERRSSCCTAADAA